MKFSNGCWLNRDGVTSYSPACIYDVKSDEKSITIVAPCNQVRHRGDTLGGPVITVKLSSPMKDIIRVQMVHYKGVRKLGPEFEIHETSEHNVSVVNNDTELSLSTGALSVLLSKTDWGMEFVREEERLTKTGFRNMAYIKTQEEGVFMREQLGMSVGEQIYGLGERFTPFIKNGQTIDSWNEDGGTSTEQSYKNIPFYLSSRGYGVFVNHPEKVSFEVGSEKVTKVQFSVPGESLDYFIINGSSLKEVLQNYTALTGRPALPPAWTFGLWLTTSFTTSYDEATVNSFVDGMAQRDIPLHVFHFDCFWMKDYNWCNLEWDTRVFPNPPEMLQKLKSKGLRICVWINPYIAQESSLFDEGAKNGYLLKRPNGDVWQWDMWQPGMGIVDFTNPSACRWFKEKLGALLDMGVDCFKTDFGERIPVDVQYYDGSDPVKMHNYYTQLYNKAVFEVLTEKRGPGEAVLFARSATAGGQQFPVHWGGDCSADYESMAESLRGGLSLCLSGFGFWSHDIGGFESTSSADVYKRWAAFGLLSSHSRLHGSTSYRVPWLYDEEAVEVVGFFTKLKCTLMPYLYKAAVEASMTGVPVMRAMLLEYPSDDVVYTLDKQYMLGESLLVAPILNDKGNASYYLPAGKWTNFITNEVHEGGRFIKEQHGYLSIPLMAKPNSMIAVGGNSSKPDYDYLEALTVHVFELDATAELQTEVYGMDGKKQLEIRLKTEKDNIAIEIKGNIKNTTPFAGVRFLFRNEFAIAALENCTVESTAQGTILTAKADSMLCRRG